MERSEIRGHIPDYADAPSGLQHQTPMPDQTKSKSSRSSHPHALTWWYGLMAIGGIGFGLLGERRPFGQGFLAHPLVAFFIVVGVGLLALRFALARPVPEVLSERALVLGCLVGAASFLVGNWFGVNLAAVR